MRVFHRYAAQTAVERAGKPNALENSRTWTLEANTMGLAAAAAAVPPVDRGGAVGLHMVRVLHYFIINTKVEM